MPSPTPNYLWTILWRIQPIHSPAASVAALYVLLLLRADAFGYGISESECHSSLSVSKHKTKSSQLVELKVKMTEKTKWNSHLKQQTQVLSGH